MSISGGRVRHMDEYGLSGRNEGNEEIMARVLATDSIKGTGRVATAFAFWIVLAGIVSLCAPGVTVLRTGEQLTLFTARARYCYAELQLVYRIAIRVDEPERQQQVSKSKPPITTAAEHSPCSLLRFIVTGSRTRANKDLDRRCATVMRRCDGELMAGPG
jgi:hypothetical protein